jgi:murein DD-endopeptidase MepM/ murein hydrolase activator NlpD
MRDYFLVIIALLIVAAIGGMMYFNTIATAREEVIKEQSKIIHNLETEVYYATRPRVEYVNPLKEYWISSLTGYRTDPMGGGEDRLHKGLDLTAPRGTEIVAVMDGIVMEHWPPPNGVYSGHPIYGGMVVIEHHGFYSLYGHLSRTYVHEGDWVQRGEVIGVIGNTGISTGRHLHLEIIVNPFDYLEGR